MTFLSNKTFIFFTCCVLVFLSAPTGLFAQSSLSLSVTPTLFEMSANPGQLWQSQVKVINSNAYELVVYPQVVNFAPQGETGQGKLLPVFENMTEGTTLAEWFDIDTSAVVIPPDSSAQLPFVVAVPEDASPGGHFAAILVSTKPPDSEDRLAVKTAQIVTSLFFARVAGDVVEKGTIRSFSAQKQFAQTPEATFELRFENKGNVHLQPRGEIRIFNMWGKERGFIPINENTHFGNVLPESVRKFEFSWKGEQSFNDIGRYRAEVALAYGDGSKQFVTSNTHFMVVPVKPILVTLSILSIMLFAIIWMVKLYVRRMLELAGVPAHASVRQRTVDSSHEGDVRIGTYRSIAAPVRIGFVDLKTHLSGTSALLDRCTAVWNFVVRYKKFFIALIISLLGIYVTYMFFDDVTQSSKSYDIAIENPDTTLTLSSEEIVYREIAEQEGLPTLGDETEQSFALMVINTSGEAGIAGKTAAALARENYTVTSVSFDEARNDKRTIIVFDQSLQEEALLISKQLDGALLSARPEENAAIPTITVYAGVDRIVQ